MKAARQELLFDNGIGPTTKFGSYHYVPLLKTLMGELEALKRAEESVWDRMTPMLEVAAKVDDPDGDPLYRGLGKRLVAAIGTDRLWFLDFHDSVGLAGVRSVLEQCAAFGLRFVPVVVSSRSRRVPLIRQAIGFDRGVCFRLRVSGVVPTGDVVRTYLAELVEAVGVDIASCDLVLDAGYITQSPDALARRIARDLEQVDSLGTWRSVALVGTSVPERLQNVIQPDTIGSVARAERRLRRSLQELRPRLLPAHGDYAVQHPTRPSGGFAPISNIRYTSDEEILIVRGHDPGGYAALARLLCSEREYRGADFSWGDAQIATCAGSESYTQSPQRWRAIASSHHFKVATEELAREAA